MCMDIDVLGIWHLLPEYDDIQPRHFVQYWILRQSIGLRRRGCNNKTR